MAEILEVIMIVSFGASWPLNVVKSYKARTTKGKSLGFLCLIFFGYVAGIASKILNESYMSSFSSKWYVLFFYVLNLLMVGTDLCIYFRNYKLDKKRNWTQLLLANPFVSVIMLSDRYFREGNYYDRKRKNDLG